MDIGQSITVKRNEVNPKDMKEQTALQLTMKRQCMEKNKIDLETGVNINNHDCDKDKDCRIGPHFAVKEPNTDVKIKNRYNNPLHTALRNCRFKMAKYIFKNAADVDINVQDHEGNTPLHIAVLKSHTQTVVLCSLLLERGANVRLRNDDGQTPLHCAISGNRHIVATLLNSFSGKMAVNIPDNKNDYPLHVATRMGDIALIKLLLDNGAEINCKDFDGQTPLHMAWREPEIRVLLKEGAEVNVCDSYGLTPLQKAIKRHDEFIHILLKSEANINYKNYSRESPLHTAIKANNSEAVEVLLKCGVNVNFKDIYGKTPLTYVQSSTNAEALLQMGAKVDVKDNVGKTVLHHLDEKDTAAVDMLLDWGASPTTCDVNGYKTSALCRYTVNYEVRKHCVKLPSYLEGAVYLNSYRELCQKEANRLKLERFGNHSLHCIFDQISNPRYLGNKALEKAVNSKDLVKRFPVYNSLLKSTYKKARNREDLIKAVLPTFQALLPEEIVRYILAFVDDISLYNVMEAKRI